MKAYIIIAVLIFLTGSYAHSQNFEVSGRIIDSKTNKGLEFATVRVAGTDAGTTADAEGNYIIRLSRGAHELIASYIGYNTDTARIFIDAQNTERDIYLMPAELTTQTIDVYGEDPAYEIMRRVIETKRKFRDKLNEYEYDAYSKFVIRSDQRSVKVDTVKKSGKDDDLGIFGILESESVGYFRKPGLEKQIIKSKRETENIIRGIALPFFVNFYDDEIDVGEFKILTPVADNAFGSYDYRLIGVTSMDSMRVFKIEVISKSELSPLLNGVIYVADSLFSVLKVDLNSNGAANPRLVENIRFQQKFLPFDDRKTGYRYWMPTDIQIFAGGSFAGIAKFNAEVLSVISEYRINKKAPAGVFDEYVIKVLPQAGDKDTAYWNSNRKLRETPEEIKAFEEIGKKTKKEAKSLSIGLGSISYGNRVSTNPLSYYRYNRIEGSALRFNLDYNKPLGGPRINSFFSYGFSDKKTKYGVSYSQRLIDGWKLQLSGEAYNTLSPISYGEIPSADIFINTFTGLFDKTDAYDYYYASGFNVSANYWLMPQANVGISYMNEEQKTAYTSTNFSVRKKEDEFSLNPAVNEGVQRTIGVNMRLNVNEYGGIDWGDGSESIFRENTFPVLDAGFIYSGKEFFKSAFEYRKFYARLSGRKYFNRIFNVRYELGGIYANGEVPYQSLGFLNSRQGHIDMGRNFGSTHINEFPGDRIWYVTLRNNFSNVLWSKVPFFKSIRLAGYVNVMRNEITGKNMDFSAYKGFRISDGIYAETGFALTNILELFELGFTWKLTNTSDSSRDFYLTLTAVSF
ncbi:MAG: DUF5686 and carboxypeptidase regulatory-like domain-containing protein [Ignavibacteria bacterium]|nr:DUF5686 and carboxypeptidase regulatory-like domain-containing protein [Ignavibacteria bacterium]